MNRIRPRPGLADHAHRVPWVACGAHYVAGMSRYCARPGCSELAIATLAFDYRSRVTWLDPLADERHPMAYDLCDRHADGVTVPRGWRLEDRTGVG